jgi:DNA-binding transcriptional MocR family regulator
MLEAAKPPLYREIANLFTRQVCSGALRPGDRVPSLRRLSREHRVSMSTAQQAYFWLESRGYLEARPQSGFYVRTPPSRIIPEPQYELRPSRAAESLSDAILSDILAAAEDPANIPFGAGVASPELFPNRRLGLILRRLIRRQPLHSSYYTFPPGAEILRQQITRRAAEVGCNVSREEIIITCGALEAINLALRSVARPGTAIAVESPTYFGILGTAASLGMKVIEVPTHPQQGMDLVELDRAVRRHNVEVCVTQTNCQNPLGYVVSDDQKKALIALADKHKLIVIEDEVYRDLTFEGPQPRSLKCFDRQGRVLLCSSVSKTLSPGLRIGWVAAGKYRAQVERLKLLTTVATASLPQTVVAEFLASGGYDRHLRHLRGMLAAQMEAVRQAIAKYFPAGSRISRPLGGYMLWVQLPQGVEALALYRDALAEHISILPGMIFSASGRFKDFIRINCGHVWSEAHERALLRLGRLCEKHFDQAAAASRSKIFGRRFGAVSAVFQSNH